MKKFWMFLLLTPLLSISATYPHYDEEYETSHDAELAESYIDEWNDESAQQDEVAIDNDAQEDTYATPKRSKAQTAAPSAQKRQSPAKRNSASNRASTRSKMNDLRQNPNRPRVTQRGYEQKDAYNAGQVEADAYSEEQNEQNEQPRKQYQSPKARRSQAAVEEKAKPSQRHSSFNQKRIQGKTYRQAAKKAQHRAKSAHPGKRPIGE